MEFTGKDLIAAGFKPGAYFQAMLAEANAYGMIDVGALSRHLPRPVMPLVEGRTFTMLAEATTPEEAANLAAVTETMNVLMKTPVVRAGAAMPDACPAGPVGTIPVGGVVASTEIHPGMHSADICCSVQITIWDNADPKELLDAVHATTHFGPGGRDDDANMPVRLYEQVLGNRFTRQHVGVANSHMGTQGDGNHFSYVGTMKSTGKTALVTHHGSRGFGAAVYKEGMRVAEQYRQKLSPATLKMNAWIPADSDDGREYWEALQIVRRWTKYNHGVIHRRAANLIPDPALLRTFWNEHNFIFKRADGLFYHGKGATPAFDDWAEDAGAETLIPLNMAQPILIARGLNNPQALGFAPHGAGRNMSRTKHLAQWTSTVEAETEGLDVRFHCGLPDASELPSAYKDAGAVREQIERFGMAQIVDEVLPYGCIMAGNGENDAPWRKKK
jgi:tRNA-splicing ligase RtcB